MLWEVAALNIRLKLLKKSSEDMHFEQNCRVLFHNEPSSKHSEAPQ